MKRTEKELLMKRVGKWLGGGYRFGRVRNRYLTGPAVANCGFAAGGQRRFKFPRRWTFRF